MTVIIGIDPHKASHAAFAIDDNEVELAQLSVRAGQCQLERLLCWARPFRTRTWAIESAGVAATALRATQMRAPSHVSKRTRSRQRSLLAR